MAEETIKRSHDLTDMENTCVICYDDLSGNEYRCKRCNSGFDSSCLRRFIRHNASVNIKCPYCMLEWEKGDYEFDADGGYLLSYSGLRDDIPIGEITMVVLEGDDGDEIRRTTFSNYWNLPLPPAMSFYRDCLKTMASERSFVGDVIKASTKRTNIFNVFGDERYHLYTRIANHTSSIAHVSVITTSYNDNLFTDCSYNVVVGINGIIEKKYKFEINADDKFSARIKNMDNDIQIDRYTDYTERTSALESIAKIVYNCIKVEDGNVMVHDPDNDFYMLTMD